MLEKIKTSFHGFKEGVKNASDSTLFGVRLAFKAAKFETILNILVFTLEQFPSIITSFALKMIIDSCISGENMAVNVGIWVVCYLASLLVSRGLSSLGGILTVSLRKKFELYLDEKIIGRVLDSGVAFFDDPANMDSLRIVQNESGVINSVVFVGLRTFSSCLALAASILILSALSPWLTVLYILAVIPAVVADSKFNFLVWQYDFTHSRDYRRSDNIYSEITDQRKGIEFRLYGNFPAFKKEYFNLRERWISEKAGMFKTHAWKLLFSYLLQTVSLAGVFVLSVIRFMAYEITVGEVQFYVNTALSIRNSVMAFFDNVTSIAIYGDKVSKIKNFLLGREHYRNTGNLDVPKDFEITFNNVGFHYPGSGEWVLRHCSFSFGRGDKVALVGLNGAGKSTVIKLLLGFYSVSEGEILLNGVPIEKYDKASYSRLFGAMFQDIVVYSMSIRENITLGCELDEERLKSACDFAGISDLIASLPQGFETQLGRTFDENGFVPSGGQAQRIALARAYYRSGDIMILDEPVASIDPETEFEIFEKVGRDWKDKTMLLVSHRLSNVRDCDKIIVIEDGAVSQCGTHDELIAEGGKYAEMYLTQAEKYTQ